jgi:hypothetical protein
MESIMSLIVAGLRRVVGCVGSDLVPHAVPIKAILAISTQLWVLMNFLISYREFPPQDAIAFRDGTA